MWFHSCFKAERKGSMQEPEAAKGLFTSMSLMESLHVATQEIVGHPHSS